MRLRLLMALAILTLVLATVAGVAGTDPGAPAGASAHAFAIKVVVPGQTGAVTAAVSAPPDAVAFGDAFAYPADGSVVASGSVSSGASTQASGSASATASSEVTALSLFGGEVTADDVSGKARAAASGSSAAGDVSGSTVANLVVLGQSVTVTPNGRVPLADWGYATVLEQSAVQAAPAGAQGYRGFVTALDVHLTAPHGGLPAGSEIQVGHAEAAAQTSPPPPVTTTPQPAPRKAPAAKKAPRPVAPKVVAPPSLPARPRQPEVPKKAPEPKRPVPGLPPPVRRPPPGITPKLTAGGYVFPVYGPSSFVDTFGAPRADVSYHHGDDVFAPLGAPVLAVATGRLFSVGWIPIGGNRVWLRDRQGNEFYYAHLSAFSPLTKNGRRVRAGDVIGFVGNTGDAEGTPYHLHFEIHPVSLLYLGYDGAVDPTSYLLAWQRLEDLDLTAAKGWAPPTRPTSPAPKPGAILLQVTDISTASGLDPGALERALVAPVSSEGDGALVRSFDELPPGARAPTPLTRG